MKTIPITSDEHWHALRAEHIGSSEIAALFDLSPYFTKFMLHHDKAKTAPMPDPEAGNSRIWWGKKLEPIIAERIAQDMRWQLEARRVYCQSDDTPGLGCTVDRFIVDHEDGPGVLEIKDVDWLVWKNEWNEARAPAHIELQLQHQLAVTGDTWGAIGVYIQGASNEVKIYPRQPHADTIAEIKEAVPQFWAGVKAGAAPDPFGVAKELKTLGALCAPPLPELEVDLTGDAEIFEQARIFQWAREQRSFHDKIHDQAKVRLLHAIGKAAKIVLPGFDIRRDKRGTIHKCQMLDGAQPPDQSGGDNVFI